MSLRPVGALADSGDGDADHRVQSAVLLVTLFNRKLDFAQCRRGLVRRRYRWRPAPTAPGVVPKRWRNPRAKCV